MSPDSSTSYRSARRTVLKALGAGAAVGAAGWATIGAGARNRDGTRTLASLDEYAVTVHTVHMLVSGPPTNPERPADFFYEPTGLHVQPGDVIEWVATTPDHNVVSMHPAFGMQRRVPLGVDAFSSPIIGYEPSSIPGDMVEPPAPPVEGVDGGAGPEANATTTAGGANATTTANATGTGSGGGTQSAGPRPDSWLLAFDTPGVYDVLCSPHEHFGMAMRVVVGDQTEAPFETSDPDALPEPRAGPVGLARLTLTDPALEPAAIVDAGTVSWSDLQTNGDDGDDDGGNGGDADGGNGGDDDGGNGGDDGSDDGGDDGGSGTET